MKVVFSYDCEGNWGNLDWPEELLDPTRADQLVQAYRDICALHEEFNIPATFAFVGLFGMSADGRSALMNDELADHRTSFPYIDRHGGCWEGQACLDVVETSAPLLKIASHGLTHIPFTALSRGQATLEFRLAREWVQSLGDSATDGFIYPRNQVAHVDECLAHFGDYRATPANSRWVAGYEFLRSVTGLEVPQAMTSDFIHWRGGKRARVPDDGWRRVWERRLKNLNRQKERTVHAWSHPHNALTDDAYLDRLRWLLGRLDEHRTELRFEVLGVPPESSPQTR